MLAPLLLLASTAHADVLKATLRLDGDRVVLVSATRLPGDAPVADGDLEVLDAAGRVVGRAPRPPFAAHRSVLLPEGPQTARVPQRYARVTLPWPEGAATLRVDGRAVDVDPARLRLAAAEGATLVHGDGLPERRLDLVVLAEGYTTDRADAFAAHVDAVVDHLLDQAPFDAYAGLLDVWTAFVPSSAGGIDDPARGLDVDSPFGCAYGCDLGDAATDRLICCDEAAVAATVEARAPFADGVLLLVDDTKYGGSGGLDYAVAYTGDDVALQVAVHELGHALLGLWDEYPYGLEPEPGVRYASPNCGEPDAPVPWEAWLDDGPIAWPLWHAVDALGDDGLAGDGWPTATAPGAVCAFPACSFDRFVSPTRGACRMHTLGQPWCPVCREAVVEALWRAAGGLVGDAAPPRGSEVVVAEDEPQTLTVTPAEPGLTITWTHRGHVLGTGPALTLDGDARVCGTVTATVSDPTTWVRDDADDLLHDVVSWEVRAGPCCGCATATPVPALPALLLALVARRRRTR